MSDVFISYKKERRAHAERLAAVLEAHGYDVWWDYELAVGPDYRAQIERRLDTAKTVLVLWCTGSVQSRFVRSEAGRADRRGKLLEAYLESVEAPVGFGEAQGGRLIGWTGAPEHDGVAGLIRAIAEKTGREPHPRANVLRMLAQLPALPALKPIRAMPEDEAYPDEPVAERRGGGSGRTPARKRRGALVPIAAGVVFLALLGAGGVSAWHAGWVPGLSPMVWRQAATASPPGQTPGRRDDANVREADDLVVAARTAAGMAPDVVSTAKPNAPEETARQTDEREAREQLAAGAAAAWPGVSPNDPAALRRFIAAYDATPEAQQAELRLVALDVAAWQRTRADGTVRAAQDYLSDFPESAEPPGEHAAELARALENHGPAVYSIQEALNAQGFDVGTPDGRVGARTEQAVDAFAAESGLRVTDLELLDAASLLAFADRIARWERPKATPAVVDAPAAGSGSLTAGETFRDCDDCPEIVVIPGGSFMMGSPESESGSMAAYEEQPQHEVQISAFAAGKFEVTWDEWNACVLSGGCDGYRPYDEGWGQGRRPIIHVEQGHAQAYVRWLSQRTGKTYRLLTEAEWEYAARAGTTGAYWWGDYASHEYANYGSESCCSGLVRGRDQWMNTAPVGSFPANAFGLHDMNGNVWERVEDCVGDDYDGAPSDGSSVAPAGCIAHVYRGGAWNVPPHSLRSANRGGDLDTNDYSTQGFRVARVL